jgi:hypothetical protein
MPKGEDNNSKDPAIEIRIGSAGRNIHRKHLAERSEVFRELMRHGDELENAIELEPEEGFRDEIYESFLEFLSTGKAKISGENAFSLLVLANEYIVPELKSACISFIGDNIDTGNLLDILDGAIDWELNDLKWQCAAFAFENSEDAALQELLESDFISEEARGILEYGIKCRHLKPPQLPPHEG